jgi:hypothetical protein
VGVSPRVLSANEYAEAPPTPPRHALRAREEGRKSTAMAIRVRDFVAPRNDDGKRQAILSRIRASIPASPAPAVRAGLSARSCRRG